MLLEKNVRNSENEVFLKTLGFLDNFCVSIMGEPFKNIDDLSLDNLRFFLAAVLKNYKNGIINHMTLKNIADGLEAFIFEKYGPEYPILSYEDEKSIGLEALDHIMESSSLLKFTLFPEDADFFIECLESPASQSVETNKKMAQYVERLEGIKRYEDGLRRGYLKKIENHSEKSKNERLNQIISTYIDSKGTIHEVNKNQSGCSISILWAEGDMKRIPIENGLL